MNESSVWHRILLACSTGATRLFRNNVGVSWQGKSERITSERTVRVFPGDVVIRQAQPVKYGLCVGSSDGIGWTSRRITQADVGATWALFTAIEAKSDTGRPTPEQKNFIAQVQQAGGLAGIARSDTEALTIVSTPITVVSPTKE